MADITTTGVSNADEAAKQEEERAKRRAALEAEIHMWNSRLGRVNSQISDLTTEQSNLNSYLGNWEAQKSIYSGNDILSEVVIVNVFEGVCADKIKTELENCIAEMDQSHSKINGLNGNVRLQISRLHEYVSTINGKLTVLNNELNSL